MGVLGGADGPEGLESINSRVWGKKALMDMVIPGVRMVKSSTFRKSPKETTALMLSQRHHCFKENMGETL